MVLVTVENVGKSYGTRRLFGDVTFGIEEGDKIGVIGVNGTGKSTFLKIMAGAEPLEEGDIQTKKGLVIEYLPQDPDFDETDTILGQVLNSDTSVFRIVREYEEAVIEASMNENDARVQEKLMKAASAVDAAGGWQLESEAKTVLTKLGITDFSQTIENLSGGQKKRVALARALIAPSDLLILDEPTNHLDNDTIAWLEAYLASRKGALLMVTHDRYFLDRVATRMLEIDNGKVYAYSGNYSEFLEKKAEREELAQASERKRQNLLRNELAWVRRGAQARSTKQKARLERFEDLKSQDAPTVQAEMVIKAGSSRLGRKTIELENVSKTYDDKLVVKDFSYIVGRHDRLGIIGPNGAGKSTLLKSLFGLVRIHSGALTLRGQDIT
ncbi:MAG: ABC-F family ATP-binding cassette domain-containing protein, partial [Selenomonadales bacterium]|nr:ABC-F family ATP-binding cassette domain-containing protein [Selenomonadales bacterium]